VKVLIVKMSSLGDVVHAIPALVDAKRENPDVEIDWVVEEGFVDIPQMHVAVDRVIPIAIRRWRKNWLKSISSGEVAKFISALRRSKYDLVIDAQGLIKSAIVAGLARGPVGGFNVKSAREPIASFSYNRMVPVERDLHAVERQRRLFSGLLGYQQHGEADYGFDQSQANGEPRNAIMLLHGTTWASKHWPESSWISLCKNLLDSGYEVLIPSGNEEERNRALSIANLTSAQVLAPMGLNDLISVMSTCRGIVTLDTGLGHLACALNVPLVGLYGSTDPVLTGVYGPNQEALVSNHLPCIPCKERNCRYAVEDFAGKIYPPCFEKLTPESVWQALQLQISKVSRSAH
jgi:heptosyltransferase-1